MKKEGKIAPVANKPGVGVEQVKNARRGLELLLAHRIQEFEKATGTSVTSICLGRRWNLGNVIRIANIKVEID